MAKGDKLPNPLQASHILQDPDVVDRFPGPYVMMVDGSFLSGLGVPSHERLVDAINLLAGRGWEPSASVMIGERCLPC